MTKQTTAGFTQSSATHEAEQALLKHLPLVRLLARKIHRRLPQGLDIEDLYSAGVIGLMDAVTKFNPLREIKFVSFAQFRIRGAILDSLRVLDWAPRQLRHRGRKIEDTIQILTARLGHAPEEEEVAMEMGISLNVYQKLLGDLKGLEIGSLQQERHEDSGEEELAYIPGKPEDDPLFRCLKSEMKERLISAIEKLPERERVVMTLYYYEELNMREIGLALGVDGTRVSQVHASAVLHLRSALSDIPTRTRKPVRRSSWNGAKPPQSAMLQRSAA